MHLCNISKVAFNSIVLCAFILLWRNSKHFIDPNCIFGWIEFAVTPKRRQHATYNKHQTKIKSNRINRELKCSIHLIHRFFFDHFVAINEFFLSILFEHEMTWIYRIKSKWITQMHVTERFSKVSYFGKTI